MLVNGRINEHRTPGRNGRDKESSAIKCRSVPRNISLAQNPRQYPMGLVALLWLPRSNTQRLAVPTTDDRQHCVLFRHSGYATVQSGNHESVHIALTWSGCSQRSTITQTGTDSNGPLPSCSSFRCACAVGNTTARQFRYSPMQHQACIKLAGVAAQVLAVRCAGARPSLLLLQGGVR